MKFKINISRQDIYHFRGWAENNNFTVTYINTHAKYSLIKTSVFNSKLLYDKAFKFIEDVTNLKIKT